jgi:mono/diheme cytochrome c family protein
MTPRLSKAGWTRSGRGGWSRPRSAPIIGSYQPPRLLQLWWLRNIFLRSQPPRLRKAGSTFFCVWCCLLFTSCGASRTRMDPQQAAGKDLFDLHCAQCHGMPQPDLLKEPPKLNGLFASKTLPSGAPATDEQVQRTVVEGLRTMPAFNGRLRRDEVWNLIAYLHTLK